MRESFTPFFFPEQLMNPTNEVVSPNSLPLRVFLCFLWGSSLFLTPTNAQAEVYSPTELFEMGVWEEGVWDVYATHNLNAADTTNADQVWLNGGLGLALSGDGVTVGVWDGGAVRSTHQAFNSVDLPDPRGGEIGDIELNATASRVAVIDNSSLSNHATHVAGTIGADNDVPGARGMASQVFIRSRSFSNDVNEMAADASLIDLSNHSYGTIRGWHDTFVSTNTSGSVHRWYGNYSLSGTEDASFGRYSSRSRSIDAVLYDNPHLVSVWSAGNDRNDSYVNRANNGRFVASFSGAPSNFHESLGGGLYVVSAATGHPIPGRDGDGGTGFDSLSNGGQTAKNVFVVGATRDHTVDPHNGASVSLTSFSSYGGTDDGRIAPHIVGNGNSLRSSTSASNSSYGNLSGTSMSAPNVTGSLALLVEHWRNEVGNDPTAASLKALAMHTATDVTNGVARVGPDYSTGYGLMNTADAALFVSDFVQEPLSIRDQHIFVDGLGANDVFDLTNLKVVSHEVKATLVWTDPEGVSRSGFDNRTSVLVNDLDLWMTDSQSNVFYPWTLDIENPTASATRDKANHVDIVEQVLIDSPSLGEILSLSIGHTGSLLNGLSQDFSLVLEGVVFIPEPSSLFLFLSAMLAFRLRR